MQDAVHHWTVVQSCYILVLTCSFLQDAIDLLSNGAIFFLHNCRRERVSELVFMPDASDQTVVQYLISSCIIFRIHTRCRLVDCCPPKIKLKIAGLNIFSPPPPPQLQTWYKMLSHSALMILLSRTLHWCVLSTDCESALLYI